MATGEKKRGLRVLSALLSCALLSQAIVLSAFVPPAAAAAQADGAETGSPSLSQMLAERSNEQVERARKTKKTGTTISAFAGLGAALACGAGRSSASNMRKLLCTAAGAAVAYTGILLTNAIAKKLVEKDQKKVLAAASQSLRSGEPQQLVLPDSSASASVAGSGQPVFREATVNIFYDTVRVADVGKIRVVAEPHVVTRANTILRDTPSAKGKVSGKLAANQPLYVSGQVADSNWYLVSERVVEGQESAMMAVGYVEAGQLKRSAPDAVLPGRAPPTTIARRDVVAVLKCDKLGFVVRDAKGKETNSTSELCLGPEGTPISV